MAKQFKFLEWQVYNDSQELFTDILKIVNETPKEYRFELGNQIIRSSLSVVLNIAEGSGKQSNKELNRYIEIAFGSLYETLAGIDTLRRNSMIGNKKFKSIHDKISSICKQLGGFKKKISGQS